MLLIQSLVNQGDLPVRVHIRSQMESSGLKRILDKHAVFDHPGLRRVISDYQEDAKSDELEIAESMKEDIKMNFSDPRGIFDAVLANTEGRALDFFSSSLKHLLLVPPDSDLRLRYFQLVDKLVSSVVTDRKGLDGDFSSMLGSSVASIVSKFGDQERLEIALEDAADAKATISRMKREREALEEEIAQKDQGLVGKLKAQVEATERALVTSRSATQTLMSEMVEIERINQEKVTALETQAEGLFNMLDETNLLETIRDQDGTLDRTELVDLMQKKIQRTKAIRKLEGTPAFSVTKANVRVTEIDETPEDFARALIEESRMAKGKDLVGFD